MFADPQYAGGAHVAPKRSRVWWRGGNLHGSNRPGLGRRLDHRDARRHGTARCRYNGQHCE
jgi:hypothetical protein